MTDHADIVRKALNFTPDVVGNKPTRKDLAYRALDALVAERDDALVRALEVALEWIDMRCNVAEFPESHKLIHDALAAPKPRSCPPDDRDCNYPECSCEEMP